jgi:putative phage-type endonuclease
MSLTAEQLALRENGIGSSDVPAICHVNPWRTPLSVWCAKRTPTRGPLIASKSSTKTRAGHEFEEAIARLYSEQMGVKLRRSGTVVNKTEPWIMATPDRLVVGQRVAVEIKLVGVNVMHHWHGGIPDYVRLQAAWQMLAIDYEAVDVVAMIGTDYPIVRVHRDPDLERQIVDVAREFWIKNVLGDTPPPDTNEEDREAYLLARYPRPSDSMIRSTPEIDEAVMKTFATAQDVESAEEAHRRARNDVLELIGDARGVRGPWGSASAPLVLGHVNWKAAALELCGGVLPDGIEDRHRGESSRRLGIYKKRKKND